jgi:hypothetical protein
VSRTFGLRRLACNLGALSRCPRQHVGKLAASSLMPLYYSGVQGLTVPRSEDRGKPALTALVSASSHAHGNAVGIW